MGREIIMNKIIQALENHPCTYDELPGKLSPSRMSIKNRLRVRHIKISGNHSKKPGRGLFKTIYYLEGDRAIQKFVEINAEPISHLDFDRYTTLDSGLPREISQKIRAAIK